MNQFSFKKNLQFKLKGTPHTLVQLIGDQWQVRNEFSGEIKNIKKHDLMQKYVSNEISFDEATVGRFLTKSESNEIMLKQLDLLPVAEQEKLKQIRLALEKYIEDWGGLLSRNYIQIFITENWGKFAVDVKKPSVTTFYIWLKRYLKSGKNILSLSKQVNLRGNRKPRLDKSVIKICEDAINEIYMQRTQGSILATLDKAKLVVMTENKCLPKSQQLPIPTKTTISRLLARIPKEEVDAARLGATVARMKNRTSVGSAIVDAALVRVEMDHTLLDFIVVDDRTGLPIGRPWISLAIDVFTRAILGIYITFEPPSHASVAALLKFCMMPKSNLKETCPGLKGNWDMHGIPVEIVVDNGLEFHGRALENACLNLGIVITYCPRKQPWKKGTVERVLGTMNRAIGDLIPGGRTFSSIKQKGDYDPVKTACVSFGTLKNTITRWIVDVYHHTYHRGIDTTPYQKWNTSIDPEDIPLPAKPHELDAITGNIDTRIIWHYGIEINNLVYNSPELGYIRTKFKEKATIRWMPDDVGHIYVMTPDGEVLKVPVLPKKAYVKGLSLYAFKICRQYLIDNDQDPDDEYCMLQIMEQLRQGLDEDAKLMKKKTRVFQKRLESGLPEKVDKVKHSTAPVPTGLPPSGKKIQVIKTKRTLNKRG